VPRDDEVAYLRCGDLVSDLHDQRTLADVLQNAHGVLLST